MYSGRKQALSHFLLRQCYTVGAYCGSINSVILIPMQITKITGSNFALFPASSVCYRYISIQLFLHNNVANTHVRIYVNWENHKRNS